MAKSNTNTPLDIASALFNNKEKIYGMTAENAKQSLYIVLRRLAIMYPEQANLFNISKINHLDVLKFWSDYLYKAGSKVPYWMYISGANKQQEKKAKSSDVTKKDILDYRNHFSIGTKDFESMMKLYPEETINEIKEYISLNKTLKGNESA